MKPWLGISVLLWGLAGAAQAEVRILCLGDSLTEGYGVSKEEAWPALLEARLREQGRTDVTVMNAGVSGSTSASAVSRLNWHLKSRPHLVILALGANDGLRGVNPAETKKNLAAAIRLAQSQGAKVVLTGMKMPPNYGESYTRRFAAVFPALAKQYPVTLVPFLLEGIAGDPALNLPDGIHPNAAGYQKIADMLLPYLRTLL